MRRYCSCQDASFYTRDKYGGGDTLGCSSPSPYPISEYWGGGLVRWGKERSEEGVLSIYN